MEYSLSYHEENINKLARFIARVVTSRDKIRAEQKQIRARISYALTTGKLEELKEGKIVEVKPFFKWAIEIWPQLHKVGGLPKQAESVIANTASFTLTKFPADIYFVPVDVNVLKENYILKKEIDEKIEIIRTLETQLDAFSFKDKQHREYSAKGGRNSRGKSKNY